MSQSLGAHLAESFDAEATAAQRRRNDIESGIGYRERDDGARVRFGHTEPGE